MKKNIIGFTLIELMITVAIVAILAAIAYPSYQEHVSKSRRADAKGAMLGFATAMERHYTSTGSYLGAAIGGGDKGAPTIFATEAPVDGSAKYYNLTIFDATASSYTLQATPKNAQAGDLCGNLSITHAGVKTYSGAKGTKALCW